VILSAKLSVVTNVYRDSETIHDSMELAVAQIVEVQGHYVMLAGGGLAESKIPSMIL
jgi:hypothetical protein